MIVPPILIPLFSHAHSRRFPLLSRPFVAYYAPTLAGFVRQLPYRFAAAGFPFSFRLLFYCKTVSAAACRREMSSSRLPHNLIYK